MEAINLEERLYIMVMSDNDIRFVMGGNGFPVYFHDFNDNSTVLGAYGDAIDDSEVTVNDDAIDTNFIRLELDGVPYPFLSLMPDSQVPVLRKEENVEKIEWCNASSLAKGDNLLEHLPRISYTGREQIDRDVLNEIAIRMFYKPGASRSYNTYATLFKKNPTITNEAEILLGAAYATGTKMLRMENAKPRVTLNIPSPVEDSLNKFLGQALDDLAIDSTPYLNDKKNRDNTQNTRINIDGAQMYVLMSYLFGENNENKDITKVANISRDGNLAFLYGMFASKLYTNRRDGTIYIYAYDSTAYIVINSMLTIAGIRPTCKVTTKKKVINGVANKVLSYRFTTKSPIVSSIYGSPMNIEEIRNLFSKASDMNGASRRLFYTDGEDRYVVRRLKERTNAYGTVNLISHGGYGFISNNLSVAGDVVSEQAIHNSEIDNGDHRDQKTRYIERVKNGVITKKSPAITPRKIDDTKKSVKKESPYRSNRPTISTSSLVSSNGFLMNVCDVDETVDAISFMNHDEICANSMTPVNKICSAYDIVVSGLGHTVISEDAMISAQQSVRMCDIKEVKSTSYVTDIPTDLSDAKWLSVDDLREGDVVFYPVPTISHDDDIVTLRTADYVDRSSRYGDGARCYDVSSDGVIWHCRHTFNAKSDSGYRVGDISTVLGIDRKYVLDVLNGKDNEFSWRIKDYIESLDMSFDIWKKYYKPNDDFKLAPTYEFDEDFAYLIGFYIADGTAAHGTVSYALNIDDKQYIKDLDEIFLRKFGRRGKLHYDPEQGKGCVLTFSLPPISNMFKALIPWTVKEKQVPEWMFNQRQSIVDALFKGLTDGDGSVKNNRYTYVSVSKKLAYQVASWLRSNGTPAYIRYAQTTCATGAVCDTYHCVSAYSPYIESVLGIEDRRGKYGGHQYRLTDDGRYYACRIRSIRKVDACEMCACSGNADAFVAESCLVQCR